MRVEHKVDSNIGTFRTFVSSGANIVDLYLPNGHSISLNVESLTALTMVIESAIDTLADIGPDTNV
jgi:hypothetical protein